jgi:hypothetical protein
MISYRAAAVWSVEFCCAVLIIILNKFIMQQLHFSLPTTLTALHFCSTALCTCVLTKCMQPNNVVGGQPSQATAKTSKESCRLTVHPNSPATKHPRASSSNAFSNGTPSVVAFMLFAGLSTSSIVLSNASLCINTVPFYQVMKLPILCFVAMLEMTTRVHVYDKEDLLIFIVILTGAAVTIRGQISTTPIGFVVSTASVVATGLQQFHCGRLQSRYKLPPSELLARVSPCMAVALLAVGPPLDGYFFDSDVRNVHWTATMVASIAVTCILAVVLNICNYAAIHLLGSGTYQALNQVKTITIVIIGALLFEHEISNLIFLGLIQTVAGSCLHVLKKNRNAPLESGSGV